MAQRKRPHNERVLVHVIGDLRRARDWTGYDLRQFVRTNLGRSGMDECSYRDLNRLVELLSADIHVHQEAKIERRGSLLLQLDSCYLDFCRRYQRRPDSEDLDAFALNLCGARINELDDGDLQTVIKRLRT